MNSRSEKHNIQKVLDSKFKQREQFLDLLVPASKVLHFLSLMVVNKEYLGFGLLVGPKKSYEDVTLGNCNELNYITKISI